MPSPGSLPAAVLWDLDGTIVDTEPRWIAAETALVHRFGGTWSHEQALTLVGSGLPDSARVLQRHGVRMEVDEIIDWLTDRVISDLRGGMPWRRGALELLRELREAGVPTALVTMSIRRMAETVASALPFDAFDTIVSGDDVAHPKPHPDPYQRADGLLGVPAEACVAIEDSPPGLASAVAAGTVAVGVPAAVALPEGEGWTLWPTLEGRGLADLAALLPRPAARP